MVILYFTQNTNHNSAIETEIAAHNAEVNCVRLTEIIHLDAKWLEI